MKRNALSNQSSVVKKQCDITTPPYMHNPIQSIGTPNFPSFNETEMNPPRKQSPIDRFKGIFKGKKRQHHSQNATRESK